jgi:hypothetical protein
MTTVLDPQQSTIEQRLASLEAQVASIVGSPSPVKEWESTIGMWKDDEFSREADRLGEEWRKSVTD